MFQLPDLPYDYNALEPFIDEETMHVHHDGHHATYIKNLNKVLQGHDNLLNMDVEELLKSLDNISPEIRTQVKNNAGGHYHHSIFWTMMTPPKTEQENGRQPQGRFLEEISNTFGNFEVFKEKFIHNALGVFGSGWTWLTQTDGRLEIMNTSNQDSLISRGQYPILGIDLWEHAYYLKYKNKRADYIQAWWNIVNWDEAEKRFLTSSGLKSS